MKTLLYNLIILLVFHTGICKAEEANKTHWSQQLSLTLLIGESHKTNESELLPLKLVLRNKTNQTLRFTVPVYDNQLVIYLSTEQGRSQRLQDLLEKIGYKQHPLKQVEIAPNDQIILTKTLDLTDFKKQNPCQSTVAFKAYYEVYKSTDVYSGISMIESNSTEYILPKHPKSQ